MPLGFHYASVGGAHTHTAVGSCVCVCVFVCLYLVFLRDCYKLGFGECNAGTVWQI